VLGLYSSTTAVPACIEAAEPLYFLGSFIGFVNFWLFTRLLSVPETGDNFRFENCCEVESVFLSRGICSSHGSSVFGLFSLSSSILPNSVSICRSIYQFYNHALYKFISSL
jgi:hypothetical protein